MRCQLPVSVRDLSALGCALTPMLACSDPLTQTAAILRTVGRALRTAADAPPSACREATVYLTEAAAAAAAAITKLLSEWAPGCEVTLVDVADLGPDTHVEVLVSAELPTRGRRGRLRVRSAAAAL